MRNKDELKAAIENIYGFKRELIQNPEQCGLWHVRFQVNGIKYYGWIAHAGAVPQIISEGCITPYHDDKGCPVTEKYYNERIKGHKVRIVRVSDRISGDWEDTGIRFTNQEEAEKYIQESNNPDYRYDFLD